MTNQYNKRLYISGMHCTACEINIGRALKEIDGVKHVKINHRTGIVDLDFTGASFPKDKVAASLRDLGYDLSDTPAKQRRATKEQWLYAGLIVLGLYLVYKYLAWIGIFNLLNISIKDISFGAAFLVGIVASLSTCLMVVGAVVMSFGTKYQSKQSHILFQVARLITFFILGGVLGLLGSWFDFSGSFYAWVTIFIAIILIWLALNTLGFLPAFGFRAPGWAMAIWDRLQKSGHRAMPLILGAFTFFLPCGFTQSMQVLALASGSFMSGALIMLFFALGTAPVLFTLGFASSRLQNRRSVVFSKAMGLLILLFGFYTLSSGLAIFGFNFGFWGTRNIGVTSQEQNIQIINMKVGLSGYEPNIFYLKKDIPVRWVIDGQAASGCTSELIVPALDIAQNVQDQQSVIEFTPTETGKIAFSCGMGMARGQFIVE